MNSLVLIFSLIFSVPQQNKQPIELGQVSWIRNFDDAVLKSKKEEKPIFILFQEVPGCHTCTKFGKDVVSHPFIVEAIETYFIPLAIYNNKGGHDKKILEKYGEPTWNNPVVRIVNSSGKDIVKRESGRYSEEAILQRITDAMHKNHIIVPDYLRNYQEELDFRNKEIEEATFSMYCFWTGEKELGKLEGVMETEAGFMGGREVVNVRFDPSILEFDDLLTSARKSNCADAVYTNDKKQETASKKMNVKVLNKSNFRKDKESKYHLYHSKFKGIPMTRLQATKINSLLARGIDPTYLLSPRQVAVMKDSGNQNVVGQDFKEVWWTKR